jgi:cyanate lyase
MLDKATATALIIEAKATKQMTWQQIADSIGMSPVWTTSACLGQNSMPKDKAKALCETLDLSEEVASALEIFPTKTWENAVPTDPLIYRLYEVIGVYGETLKEIIQEKCGDGIMSAIDFTMEVEKEENPNGNRIILTLNGKFLPYKCW